MGIEIQARFLEHIRPVGPDTDRIPGYKPAGLIIDNQVQAGYVLDIKELKRTKNLPYLHTELQLDINQDSVDISPLLKADNGGREWLEALQKRYDDQVSTEIVFKELPFTPVEYVKNPNDYFNRIRKNARYESPKAKIDTLPKGTRYAIVLPLMKTESGKWIRSLLYNRKVRDSKGKIESYSILEEGVLYGNAAGILLGNIRKEDLKKPEGDFEVDFPLEHFLEVAFPIWIGEKGRNPLSIEIRLAKK